MRDAVGDPLRKQDLLLLLQPLHEADWYLHRLRYDVRRSKGEPLREGDVGNAVRLVDFDQHELFGVRRVFNVVSASPSVWRGGKSDTRAISPRVIRERRSVASAEVEGPRIPSANEDGRPRSARVEIQPLLRLRLSASASFVGGLLPRLTKDLHWDASASHAVPWA
jgi:hypothetical protein